MAILWTSPALAHKFHVFATVDGRTIQGEVYVRAGEPVREAKIELLDAAGRKLGETVSDDEGRFQFTASTRQDHRLVARAGEGHAAEYTVTADELPADLPDAVAASSVAKPAGASPGAVRPGGRASADERLDSIQRELVQLRKDLAHANQRIRLQDVVAGIGYILGLMGLAFYFLGLRRKERARS